MRYYPLSRVVTGSKSTGTELYLNGKPYIGTYYKTWDNKYFSGNDPVTGDSQKLEILKKYTSLEENYSPNASTSYFRNNEGIASSYSNVMGAGLIDIQGFSTIISHIPMPTQLDYNRGYFYRYFAKKRNENGNIIETTSDVFNSLNSVESEYNYEVYHSIELYWQLTGPLNDTVNPANGARTHGIENTNKRLTETKDKNFKGLVAYIGGNYTKLSKVSE